MLDPSTLLFHLVLYLVIYGVLCLVIPSYAIWALLAVMALEALLVYWNYRSQ